MTPVGVAPRRRTRASRRSSSSPRSRPGGPSWRSSRRRSRSCRRSGWPRSAAGGASLAHPGAADALEQDELELELIVASERPVERLELLLGCPTASSSSRASGRSRCGSAGRTSGRSSCGSAASVGELPGRRSPAAGAGPLGLLTWERGRPADTPARLPAPGDAARDRRPLSTQPFAGNQVARQKGEGLEFADLREFAAGDRVRSINWRASARRNVLIAERAPSRAERGRDPLPRHVRRRAGRRALDARPGRTRDRDARHRYLERRDRVGLVSFGGILRWLTPGWAWAALPDRRRAARVRSRLQLRVEGRLVIPARTLPPQALVVAVTPLLDDRTSRRSLDLRARRYDLAIVEVSPAALRAGRERADRSRTASGCCARGSAPATSASASPWRPGATRAAGRRPRGGEGIPKARSARARVVAGAASVLVGAGPARGSPCWRTTGTSPARTSSRSRRSRLARRGTRPAPRGDDSGGGRAPRRRVRRDPRIRSRHARHAGTSRRRRAARGGGTRLLVARAPGTRRRRGGNLPAPDRAPGDSPRSASSASARSC